MSFNLLKYNFGKICHIERSRNVITNNENQSSTPLRPTFFILIFMLLLLANNLFSKSTFSGERLKKACIDYVHTIAGNDVEIMIAEKIEGQEFEETGVTAQCTGNEKSLKGNCYLAIEFYHNGFLKRRLQIPARIKVYGEVPVSLKTVFRGQVINEADIKIENKDITNLSDVDLIQPEELIGKKARNNLSEGSVITRLSIECEKIISKGDKVKIVVESGAIRISTAGEALQDGAIGEMIFVKREGLQVKLHGRISTDGSVIIALN